MNFDAYVREYQKFSTKIQPIGTSHPLIKYINAIRNNKVPNPLNLLPIEGIWAHARALEHNIAFDSCIIAPELISSKESQVMAEHLIEQAKASFLVSEKTMENVI